MNNEEYKTIHIEDKMKEQRKKNNRKYYEKTKQNRGKIILCNTCDGKYSYYTKYKHNLSKKHQFCLKILNTVNKINDTNE